MIGRFIVVCIPVAIYVAIRCTIFYIFLGYPLPHNAADFFRQHECVISGPEWAGVLHKNCSFDWWWSWAISVPLTFLSIAAVAGFLLAVGWVLFGSDDEEEDDERETHQHSSLG